MPVTPKQLRALRWAVQRARTSRRAYRIADPSDPLNWYDDLVREARAGLKAVEAECLQRTTRKKRK